MEEVLFPDECKICKAKLAGPSQRESHYGSERHRKKLAAFQQTRNESISEEYYCFLCCIELKDKKSKFEHIASFPHRELTTIKSELLKIGIKDQYWILDRLSTNLQAVTIICSICNVTSQCQQNFLDHIFSSKHKKAFTNWKMSPLRNLVTTLEYKNNRFYCITCDKPLDGTNEAEYHYFEKSHFDLQKVEMTVRDVTPKQTVTKCPEKASSSLDQLMQSLSLPDNCKICDVKLTGKSQANLHYGSQRHRKNLATSRLLMEGLLLPDECKICYVKLTGQSQIISHYGSERHRKNLEAFQLGKKSATSEELYFCYVCHTDLKDRKAKCEHVTSFPHKELSIQKTGLIKIGVEDEFWKLEQLSTITCILCNVTSTQQSNFLDHINGFKHRQAYFCWIISPSVKQVDAADYQNNCFFCQTCDAILDGTNEAANHYTGKSHLKLQKKRRNRSLDLDDDVSFFPSSESLESPASEIQESHKNGPIDSQNMKQQVFNELDKLVQKLYYSQSVPYDKALDLLKKINEDIEALAKEHRSSERRVLGSNESINQTLPNSQIFHKSRNPEKKQSSTATVSSAPTSANRPSNLITSNGEIQNKSLVSEIIPEKKPPTVKETSSTVSPAQHSVGGFPDQILSDVETSPKTEAIMETTDAVSPAINDHKCIISKAKNMPEFLQQIVQRREEVERNKSGKILAEKELLQEIEVLLKLIETGGIPLNILLQYLEDSNKLLEESLDEPPQIV